MVYLELRIGQMGQDDSPDNVAKGGGMTHTPNLQILTGNMEEMPPSNHLVGTCHGRIPQHHSIVREGPVRSLSWLSTCLQT